MSYRPVTLFTGQWADMPLDTLAEKAVAWGYDGLELACAGDHFEVERAATEDGYVREKREQLLAHDLDVWAISQHLVGQAVSDRIDERHEEVLPDRVWGNGDPDGVTQRAIDEVKRTAAAVSAFGVDVVTGFTGSPVWHLLYAFAPTPQEMIDEGYQQFADQWTPILDVFADEDVQFALEVHPLRLRSTSARPSARSTPLTATRPSALTLEVDRRKNIRDAWQCVKSFSLSLIVPSWCLNHVASHGSSPTDEEREELRRMKRQEVGRVSMRAHITLLSDRGYSAPKIAELHDVTDPMVYKWMDRFDEKGPAGLYDRDREGRPPKID